MLNRKFKGYLAYLLKILVSTVILWVALRQIDMKAFSADLREARPLFLAVSLLQILLIPLLGGARWWIVLRALDCAVGILVLIRLFWIGMVFNQVLPSASGGDAIRVLLASRAGIPTAKAIHSVVVERMAIMLTLAAVVEGFQPFLLKIVDMPATRLLPPVLLATLVGGLLLLMAGDKLCSHLPPWRPLAVVSRFSYDVRKVFLGMNGVWLVILCLVTNLNLSIGAFWLGNSLGLSLAFVDYVVFMPIITLITTLPISLGGWGIREGATVVLFGALGVISHSALAFSVLFGLIIAIASLPGLILFWSRTTNLVPSAV